jgi:DUF4097 and DUF4098 domain-containing protein YvlB
MRRTLLKSLAFAVLFSAALLVAAGYAYPGGLDDTISKSFAVNPGGKLFLESDIGSIEVRGSGKDKVDIEVVREVRTGREREAERILEDFDVKFNQSGNDVTVTAKYDRTGLARIFDNLGRHLRVKFIISVPENYNVDLFTSGGGISVENLRGVVKSKTSGGSLSFDRIDGEISGKTSGGSIQIGDVKGNTGVHTSGGSIRIRRAEGPVDASTSGGSITVEEVLGTIIADTSGGSITAVLTSQPKADCRLTTSGGSITVDLKDGIGVNVDARTSGGRVITDFPVTIQGEIKRNALAAKINAGGPELYLRTSGGSIRIRKQG